MVGVKAGQMLLWETDYIDGRENKEELQRVMSKHPAELGPRLR